MTFPFPTVITASYHPYAAAYFAAHTVQLDSARKKTIDTFVKTLVNNNLWADLGLLCIHKIPTQQQSLVDLIQPSRSLNIVGAPTFTANTGWVPNTSISNRLATPVNLTDSSLKFAQGNAHFGVWTNPTSNGNFIAAGTAGQHNWLEPNSSGSQWGRCQSFVNTATGAGGGGNGLHVINRSSNSQVENYYNGSLITTSTGNTSVAPGAEPMNFLNAGVSVVGNSNVMLSHMGASMNATEQLNFYNAVNTLLANL